jgi:heptosyltransferase-2/heptosyltransferase-3
MSAALTSDPLAPVVIRFAALGDVVLLTVLIQALAERYGRPVHVLGSGAWTPVLLGSDPAVGELRLIGSRRAPHWLTPSRWHADAWLRAHRGPVYHCEADVHAERIVQRAGIPEQRLVRAWQHWPGDGIHWADWWLQIAALDAPAVPGPATPISAPARPRLHPPPGWQQETEAWVQAQGLAGHRLVLLQPGHKKTHKRGRIATATHDKHWPAERWAAVAQGVLAALPGAAVLVCGSPREAGLAQEIVDAAGPAPAGARLVNAAALDLSLPRLLGLAARAHSMVSVDTGPAHVAAAMDCPLVVLYGQFGWGRWKPRAPQAGVITLGPRLPTPDAKVMDLSAAQVLDAWRQLPARVAARS